MTNKPLLMVGQSVRATGVAVDAKRTSPPPPFNESTLLEAMLNANRFVKDDDYGTKEEAEEIRAILKETEGIGTARTRVEAISGLVRSQILIPVENGKVTTLRVTDLGLDIMSMLPPEMKNIVVTAQWEMILGAVSKGEVTPDEAIEMQKQFIAYMIGHLANFNKK